MATKETNTVKPVEEKKARKPRQKVRSLEELIEATTKSMTDKEKDAIIKHLKELVNANEGKITALKNNAEAAYEQARKLQEQYESMEKFYRQNLQYVDEQTMAFAKAIQLATRGGIN